MEPVAVLEGKVAMAAVAEPFLETAEMAALLDPEGEAAMAVMAQEVLMEWCRVLLAKMVATPAMALMAARAATAVLVVLPWEPAPRASTASAGVAAMPAMPAMPAMEVLEERALPASLAQVRV